MGQPAAPGAGETWLRVHSRQVVVGGVLVTVALAGLVAVLAMRRQPASRETAARPSVPAASPAAATRPAAVASSAPGGALPADPNVLGRAAYRDGNVQVALDKYTEAIARNPNDAESLSNAGQMLVRLNKPAEAIPYFERAIALNDRRWGFHFNLAHAAGLLGQWDRAVAEYEAAAKLFPDDHVTEYNLGMALHRRGDEAAAVEHFRRAIELEPSEPDFQLSLGISSERLGRAADAVEAYKRYLDMAPGSAEAANVRAHLEALMKAPPAAPPGPPKGGVS